MKKFKRLMAISAATLLGVVMVATPVLADTGTGSSEGSAATDVYRVVLPTTTEGTYDFTMDPYDLLSTSSLDGDRDAYDGSSVYFQVEDTAATAVANYVASDTYSTGLTYVDTSLYYLDKELVVTGEQTETDACDAVTVDEDGNITAVAASTLYVWTPDAANTETGLGEYTEIDISNIEEYFTVTTSASSCDGFTYAETEACDGNLYIASYLVADAETAASYVTAYDTDDTITAIDAGLYSLVTDGSDNSYVAAESGDALLDAITYTSATSAYTGTSAAATAINKSTTPVVLSVSVTVTNTTTPVVFTDAADVNTGTDLNLAMGLSTASTSVATVSSAGTATVDYYLDGDSANYIQYQGAEDPDTGGHIYNYLESLTATWDSVSYSLTAACNVNADWIDYNDELTSENRISVEVVYSMSSTDVVAVDGDNYDATTKVISLDAAPSVEGQTYSLASASDLTFDVDLGGGESGADTITDVVFSFAGNLYSINGSMSSITSNPVFGDYCTISGDSITIAAEWLSYLSAGSDYSVYIIYDSDETFYSTLTLSVTE